MRPLKYYALVPLLAPLFFLRRVIISHKQPAYKHYVLRRDHEDEWGGDCESSDLRDLHSRGFTIVRDFLPPEMTKELMVKIRASGKRQSEDFFYHDDIGWHEHEYYQAKLEALLEQLRSEVGFKMAPRGEHPPYDVTAITGTNATDGVPLHMDNINLFFKDTSTFLNIMIMLDRPDLTLAGLRILPWDRLKRANLELYNRLRFGNHLDVYTGAPDPSEPYMTNMQDDMIIVTEPSLVQVACTTNSLKAGDLLVFNPRTLHGTASIGNGTRTSAYTRINPNIEYESDVPLRYLAWGGAIKMIDICYKIGYARTIAKKIGELLPFVSEDSLLGPIARFGCHRLEALKSGTHYTSGGP